MKCFEEFKKFSAPSFIHFCFHFFQVFHDSKTFFHDFQIPASNPIKTKETYFASEIFNLILSLKLLLICRCPSEFSPSSSTTTTTKKQEQQQQQPTCGLISKLFLKALVCSIRV